MHTLVTLLVTLASLGGEPTRPAQPDSMQRCVGSSAAVIRRIQTIVRSESAFELRDYKANQARDVLQIFNAEPPSSNYAADQIMALADTSEEGNKNTLVLLMTTGCITQIIQTSRKSWQAVIQKSIGSDV
jgi:hypothetical protein